MIKNTPTRADWKEQQVLGALEKIGKGSAEEVILELSRRGSKVDPVPYLQVLLDKGQIERENVNGATSYHLNS